MLNIDPLLFQPKVIRMSTTSSIGHHIIRTTEYSNSQIMTGTAAHLHNEANNNILIMNNTVDTAGEFASRGRDFGSISGAKDLRNFNEMELSGGMDQESADLVSQQAEWTGEMYWSGEGDGSDSSMLERIAHQNSESIMSFQSNLSNSTPSTSFHSQLSEQSDSKEEIIHSMLIKVRSQNKVEASKVLLAMSNTVENCIAMRQCGCIPLLIQLLHSPDENSNTYHMMHAKRVNFEIRERASQVLHNIVFSQPDDKKGRREARVLRLLEQIRDYCDELRNLDVDVDDNRNSRCVDQHIGPTVAALMKLSFDEDHRHAMCQLGGLQSIAELLQVDHEVHGCTSDQYCITIRRYSGMALTNLTFGDGANKALLCSFRSFMEALVAQLYSPSEDLRQVTASVLRNLSWRADPTCKRILRDTGAVTILVKAAMDAEKESTLKSILSALWNLSAHCSANKADICLVDGALAFIVSTLTYKSKSKTLAIVENGGGILRNISSHIAIQNEYRAILRKHNCLQILLQHLKSPSLTVVSNACGTLWNLSARNAGDQRALWEMGAVGMLKKLINSKHKMISMGSSAALKNLLSAKPPGVTLGMCVHNDGTKFGNETPSLHIRKEKALIQEIDENLAETYDNTDSPKSSPSHQATNDKNNRKMRHISPSAARYLANQKKRNDLLSLQKQQRVDEKLTYVVEEKHNGAFQVTKNTKPTNYQQGQNRIQTDPSHDKYEIDRYEYTKCKKKPDVQAHVIKQPTNIHHESRFTSAIQPPQMGVKKDYKGTDRITNVAQVSKTACREIPEELHDTVSKNIQDLSGIPKPVHESRIPLPKSCKLDAQRSQSASPVPQRRSVLPQRQNNAHNIAFKNVDVNVTHPKCAWNSSNGEKEDNEPEQHVKFTRAKDSSLPESKTHSKPFQTFQPPVSQVDEYGSEDEIKVYNTENTPMNYCLNESLNDLEEPGASSRCSLNIRTCTNVKLMKNHPLLSNVGNNKGDDNSARMFEYRHASKDYRNFEGGKTVDFSVQGDYEIDENLSMMSRSNSEGSLGSFDQQSFHEDESFASDISRHTSGIESPSELSDSPCQTVPSSPEKATKSSNAVCRSNSSDIHQMKLAAVDGDTEQSRILLKNDGERVLEADLRPMQSRKTSEFVDSRLSEVQGDDATVAKEKVTVEVSSSSAHVMKSSNEIDLLAAKLADENYSSPEKISEAAIKNKGLESEKLKTFSDEQSISEITESADFVTCVSEFPSSSSVESETMEDISPTERVLLEKCIRAGLPQNQGVKQKVPQLSYQLLKDTVEKHPKACSFDTERGTTCLKTLELKEAEYESHSENEEKGKEDERRAEKKRLFRIPESPIDKKIDGTLESEKNNTSKEVATEINDQPTLYTMKVVVDQKGNRRCEKHSDKTKSKQKASEPVPSQLDFLMTSKKCTTEVKNGSSLPSKIVTSLQQPERKENSNLQHKELHNGNSGKKDTDVNMSEEMKFREIVRNQEDKLYPIVKPEDVAESNLSNKSAIKDERTTECNEMENGSDLEDSMMSSSLLCEAREIAEALLGARVGSTEDMTVSTLSCLSDVDSARPPSVLSDMGCLSMTNSMGSEENLKAAVTKECQKILGKTYNKQSSSYKKSLLRELQIGRLNNEHGSNDHSNGSNGSPENSSLKSNSTSDLLGNVNPPSILDQMSLTASTASLNGMEGSDSECDSERINAPYPSKMDSMSERMHNAAAIANLYAKELSNITGNCVKESPSNETLTRLQNQCGSQEVMEVTIADVTEIGCDTIGSDTELDDDFPCDDDELNSETLQAPFHNSLYKDDQCEGSTENLTATLTEEPPPSPYFDFTQNNGFFMTAEELKALQENADMILNTLRDVEISDDDDDEEHCCMSTGDMLEDETMSLVSNESDDEFLSPDGNSPTQKHSPKNGFASQVCNGMIGLPLSTNNVPSKYGSKKTLLPSKLAKNGEIELKNKIPSSVTDVNSKQGQITNNRLQFSESPKKSALPVKTSQMNENSVSKIRPPVSNRRSLDLSTNDMYLNPEKQPFEQENCAFDSRTFTRKKSTVPRGIIPSIPSGHVLPSGTLRSPSSHSIPSLPGSTECVSERPCESSKIVTSKVSAAWKNEKGRSKSMVDPNRNSKFKFEKASSFGSGLSRDAVYQTERSPSQSPSPQSPLSRSSTCEKLSDDDGTYAPVATRRPSSLALSQRTSSSSPRHVKVPSSVQQRPTSNSTTQKQSGENFARPRTVASTKLDLQSPTSLQQQQNLSSIPKFQSKAQPSLIPNRRSMIPTPAKFECPDN